jgi:hypothetical protein
MDVFLSSDITKLDYVAENQEDIQLRMGGRRVQVTTQASSLACTGAASTCRAPDGAEPLEADVDANRDKTVQRVELTRSGRG